MTTLTKPTLRSTLPSFFNDFFDDDFSLTRSPRNITMPPANITETENAFNIELAVPGMRKEDFSIDVDNRVLRISSERTEEKKEEEQEYTRREFSYHTFSRSFGLPEAVDTDKIKARYQDGVLKLELPKREEARKQKRKEISIN